MQTIKNISIQWCKLLLVNSHQLSCKLSLVNSHHFSCNSCSRLTGARELRKLSCKLSLVNSHQLSCNSCSRLTRTRELRKLSRKLSLVNSHATLVLFDWDTRVDMRIEENSRLLILIPLILVCPPLFEKTNIKLSKYEFKLFTFLQVKIMGGGGGGGARAPLGSP